MIINNENKKVKYPLMTEKDIKKDLERSIKQIYKKFMFQSDREYEELIKKEFGGYNDE